MPAVPAVREIGSLLTGKRYMYNYRSSIKDRARTTHQRVVRPRSPAVDERVTRMFTTHEYQVQGYIPLR